MKNAILVFTLVGMLFSESGSKASSRAEGKAVIAATDYGNLPMSFEPNRGQFDRHFDYLTHGFGHTILLNSTTLKLKFRTPAKPALTTLEMTLQGADPSAVMRGTGSLAGEANYFQGTKENWITHVPTYESVQVKSVYPGIDALYYGNEGKFEYDFTVTPGASAGLIDIAFTPEANLRLSEDGDLLISIEGREIRQPTPAAYQNLAGYRTVIGSRYVLRDNHRIGFEVGKYDHSQPLVIDPQLVYSTFPWMTRDYGIAVDSAGNAYICGAGVDGFDETYTNAFVQKLNAAGTAVVWKSSFGPYAAAASATAVSVDSTGNVYVTGWTDWMLAPQPQFPTTSNAIQPHPNTSDLNSGGVSAFITKFDAGGTMVYSTFLGGSGFDRADGIAVDSLGNMYVAGQTMSTDFPVSNPFQASRRGSSNAFVTVLNAQGTAFIYSTFLGGSGSDASTGITVDAVGNAYVTGTTTSADFPIANALQASNAGGTDAFVVKLNPAGSALVYGTYLGGGGNDIAKGIALDSSGNAYITGSTNSTNFPVANAFQPNRAGGYDAFVTKLNSTGTALVYSTYLGGSNDETTGGTWCGEKPTCGGITVSPAGNAYVTGVTASPDFPQARSIQAFKGITDAYLTEFSTDGKSLMYSTLLGGANEGNENSQPTGTNNAFSSGSAVAYVNGSAYVTGLTDAFDFPSSNPATHPCCVNTAWNGIDGFVAQLEDDAQSTGGTTTYTRVEQNSSAVSYAGNWYTNTGSFNSGGNAALAEDSGSQATFTFTGTAVRWVGYQDQWSGIASVYVDGVLKTQVDTYAATAQAQAVLYSITGLSSGTHTISVQVTGTKNPSSQGNWIWVDAFDYAASNSSGSGGTSGSSGTGSNTGGTTTYTRVEQTSSAITYTRTWYSNNGPFNSGGSAVLAEDQGSRATFTFTGTDARWIGYKDAWSGIANVYVDGVLKAAVDDYSAGNQAQTVLYTVSGLPSGMHTLAVEVSGNKNPSSQGYWIWVDAFDYANNGSSSSGGGGSTTGGGGGGTTTGGGTATFARVEQNNSAVTYTGTWYSNNGAFNSGGSAVLAEDQGSRATFTFTGTDARWIGYKDAWSGIANVYVDGVLKTTVDDYSATGQAQAILYTISGLTAGTHTLTVEVSGNKNPSSQGFWVWVDAFDYATNGSGSTSGTTSGGGTTTGTYTRVEQDNPAVIYTGNWYSNSGAFNSGGSAVLALNPGSRATFTFSGTAAKWIGYRDQWSGIANVYIDGALQPQVDTYSASEEAQTVNYSITGLTSGTHTITIEVTGNKDASAQSAWVWVDAFDYLP